MKDILLWLVKVVAALLKGAATATAKTDYFSKALPIILKWEGGYDDDPRDPGGATYKGITIYRFAEHRGINLKTANLAKVKEQLRALTDAEIATIYRKYYWDVAKCGELPEGLNLIHFDCAVNQGPITAIRLLQDAIGTDADGEWGPLTAAAVKAVDVREAVQNYSVLRENRYRRTANFATFGRGWLNRLADVTKTALSWVKAPEPKAPAKGTLPWIATANDYLLNKDMDEVRGGENPEILKLWVDGKITWTDKEDETPWCSVFWNAVNERSGIPGNHSAWARDGATWGQELDGPAYGCTVVFGWDNGAGHIGFVVGSDGNGRLEVLGGNQSNTVNVSTFSTDKVIAYRWPPNVPLPDKVGMGWLPVI